MHRRIRKPRPSDGTVLLGVLSMIFSLGAAAVVVVKARPLPPVSASPVTRAQAPARMEDAPSATAAATPPRAAAPGPRSSTAASTAGIRAGQGSTIERPRISFGRYEGY